MFFLSMKWDGESVLKRMWLLIRVGFIIRINFFILKIFYYLINIIISLSL